MSRRWHRFLVPAVLSMLSVGGFILRWLYIQNISLFFDEFTSLWAARTVLQRGLPLFPSGNFYTHGLLFTYLEAPFLWALGLKEPLLRLPSLVISMSTLAASFLVGRSLFAQGSARPGYATAAAGLVAAAAAAMDPEAIAWGGRVRMYALLQLLVLLSVYVFYRGAIARDHPGQRWMALGLLVAGMFAHAEAALLLPGLALALLAVRGIRWSLRPSVVGPFLMAGLGFVAVIYGGNMGQASHLEAIHRVRPYLALPSGGIFTGLVGFAPAFLDLWRLPFTFLAASGVAVLLRRPGRGSPLFYLYLVLAISMVSLFFLAGPTWQTPRYAFMILPLLWLIADGVLVYWLRHRSTWLIAAVSLLLATFVGVAGYGTAFTQEWGYDRAFGYLQKAWQPGDVVLTTNPPACALYLDECGYYAIQLGYEEYVMRGPEGGLVDRWVGAPVLDSVEQLRDLLANASRVWLVVDGWRFQSRFENEFIRTILDQMVVAFDERGALAFVGQGYFQRPPPAVSRSLTDNFGGELALEGYELSEATLRPGGELEVTLQWRALESADTAYTVFLHLIGRDGQRVAQQDELLLGGYYQPTVWPRGETVMDRHRLNLPPYLAPGRYRLEMGLYRPDNFETVLPEGSVSDRVPLDYLTTESLQSPQPEAPLKADFGGQIQLVGYTVGCEPDAFRCDVQLYWQAVADLDTDYTVFVHLVDDAGQMAGQADSMPEEGFYPTSAWEPGEIVADEHAFDIAADVPPGDYQLRVGLYQVGSRLRLPVLGSNGQPLGDHVTLATIPVPVRQ